VSRGNGRGGRKLVGAAAGDRAVPPPQVVFVFDELGGRLIEQLRMPLLKSLPASSKESCLVFSNSNLF
jgi:hypothetical protein